jgi:hypothetical protein
VNERGFTLIELLAAMVGAALLLVLLANVTGGLSARVRQSADMDSGINPARGAAAFTALVRSATPSNDPAELTVGTSAIVFPTMRWRGNTDRDYRIAIRIEGSGQQHIVTELADATNGAVIADSREVLADRLTGARFVSDLVIEPGGDRRLASVRLIFTDPTGAPRSWVAAPPVTARPGCVFDPIAMACRQ